MRLMLSVLVLLSLTACHKERVFFDTASVQMKEGYIWKELDKCRAPNDDLPHLDMVTGTGKRLVCYKLMK